MAEVTYTLPLNLPIWIEIGLLFLAFLFMLYPVIRKVSYRVLRKRRYTQIVNQLHLLFGVINPFLISQAVRTGKMPEPDFIYGEIDTCALLDLLDIIKPHPEAIFYDLGSGIGKSTLAVKLRYPFLHVKGIELLNPLHTIALLKWKEFLKTNELKPEEFEVSFICDNILHYNISDADIVFINATAYSQTTWDQILYKLIHLKLGAKVIITSKKLSTDVFSQKYQGMELMSWGLTSTYIYEKII